MAAKIGIIGLGNMGAGIANNLIRAKVPLLAWDVVPAARKPYTKKRGVTIAKPDAMARECMAILFVVPATPQIVACLEGKDGILAHAKKRLIICDLTTSNPENTKKVARDAKKYGVEYIEAAMTGGGAVGAEAGTVNLLVGGDDKIVKKMRKYLKIFSNKIFHMGGHGAGQTMKLITNMTLHTIFLANCEGARMAERAGISLEDCIDVFNIGNTRSYISEERFPNHILSKKWDARSTVFNLNKDVGMAVDLADQMGADTPICHEASSFLKQAVKIGMEKNDFSLLYRDFDKVHRSKKRIRKTRKKK